MSEDQGFPIGGARGGDGVNPVLRGEPGVVIGGENVLGKTKSQRIVPFPELPLPRKDREGMGIGHGPGGGGGNAEVRGLPNPERSGP